MVSSSVVLGGHCVTFAVGSTKKVMRSWNLGGWNRVESALGSISTYFFLCDTSSVNPTILVVFLKCNLELMDSKLLTSFMVCVLPSFQVDRLRTYSGAV